MPEMQSTGTQPGTVGRRVTTIGVAMIALSVILAFAGISGALLHNTLQLGGLALAVVGLVVWKKFQR